ncbi:MAG: M48 family metallopeptidase [Patescibacteria group bacterium]|nr:M48 family metallopeptidase [Patescibacteria group bacterium]
MHLDNSKIKFKIIKSKKRKTIGLAVSPEGILVRCPSDLSANKLREIIQSKTKWIKTKQMLIHETQQLLRNKPLHKKVQYLGKYYDLKIKYNGKDEKILFKKGKFIANLNSSSDSKTIKQLYISWLKSRATRIIEKRISLYAKKIGVNPSKILIKDQKMRWGSATKKASLNFNWHILKAPIKIIDYVVVHELCHLKIHDHSQSFWNLVGSIMPDYELRKQWLRLNGMSFTD